jgi:hypothetical protein
LLREGIAESAPDVLEAKRRSEKAGFDPTAHETVIQGEMSPLSARPRRLEDDAETMNITEYGIKYSISGSITGPNGRSANVVSVWIILTGEDVPRFVTAYPEE